MTNLPFKVGICDQRNPSIMSPKHPPSCIQNAMVSKDRKPFTYTPGGLDLSEIKSEKMARRLMKNAMCPGVSESPKTPPVTINGHPPKPAVGFYNLPVAVFPAIQIPSNAKEMLRKTNGPNNRRMSFENDSSPPKTNEEHLIPKLSMNDTLKNESQKSNGDENINKEEANVNQVKKTIKVKKSKEKSGMKLKKKVSSKTKNNENITIRVSEEINKTTTELTVFERTKKIEKEHMSLESNTILEVETDEKNSFVKTEEELACITSTVKEDSDANDVSTEITIENIENNFSQNKSDSKEEHHTLNVPNDKVTSVVCNFKNESDLVENSDDCESKLNDSGIDSSTSDKSDSDAFPSDSNHKTDSILSEPLLNCSNSVSSPLSKITSEEMKDSEKSLLNINDNIFDIFSRSNSNQIAARRKSENIKSLNGDLDSLPSLNLCSKRFSFLRDSPPKDDPFSILTGISEKINSACKDKKKSVLFDAKKEELIVPLQKNENIPKQSLYKEESPLKPKSECIFDPNDNYLLENKNGKYDTPRINTETEETDQSQSSPKLFKDFSFLKDDSDLPAWKKELMNIAHQKKEMNEECDYYKEDVEPPWRKELRELAQSRVMKESVPSYNVWNKLVKVVENKKEVPPSLTNPIWSQTLKPKTWKERKADLSREKEDEIPEWKNSMLLRKNLMNSVVNTSTSSSSSCSSPGREVRKTPEIMIEITGQPVPAQEQKPTSNGYTYPWESSSESSTTFSPEPGYERTPTPQSRSSPFTQNSNYSNYSGLQSPVVAREYGLSNFQQNQRLMRRSCPFQSRSFKYLQMLTGTSDSYEDDEPFVPQSPQHSHLKPDNV